MARVVPNACLCAPLSCAKASCELALRSLGEGGTSRSTWNSDFFHSLLYFQGFYSSTLAKGAHAPVRLWRISPCLTPLKRTPAWQNYRGNQSQVRPSRQRYVQAEKQIRTRGQWHLRPPRLSRAFSNPKRVNSSHRGWPAPEQLLGRPSAPPATNNPENS